MVLKIKGGLCGICQRHATRPWPFEIQSLIGSYLCDDCHEATHERGLTLPREIIAYSDKKKREREEALR